MPGNQRFLPIVTGTCNSPHYNEARMPTENRAASAAGTCRHEEKEGWLPAANMFCTRRLIVPRTHDDSFNPCAAATCNKYICVLHVALRSCDARLGHLVLIRPGGPADHLAPGKPPARLLLWCRHTWSSSVCLGAHSDCRLSPLTLEAPRWCRTSFLRPMPCSKAQRFSGGLGR